MALDPEAVWCDAIAFEDFLSSGELGQAVELYRGPMLEGFLLRGSVDFDQWVERERDRLARAYTAALEELANQATQRREREAAVQWWRRLAEQDPTAHGSQCT